MRGRVSISAFRCRNYSPLVDYNISTLLRRSHDATGTSGDEGSTYNPQDASATTNVLEAIPGEERGKAGPSTGTRRPTLEDHSGVRKRKSPPSRNCHNSDDDDDGGGGGGGGDDAKFNETIDGEQFSESKRPRRERRMSFTLCDRMVMTAAVKDMVKAIPDGEYLKMVEAIKTLASSDPQTSVSYRSTYSRCTMY